MKLGHSLGSRKQAILLAVLAVLLVLACVARPAAPLTTFLVGYAAGRASQGANPISVEVLSARAAALAESWGPPS